MVHDPIVQVNLDQTDRDTNRSYDIPNHPDGVADDINMNVDEDEVMKEGGEGCQQNLTNTLP